MSSIGAPSRVFYKSEDKMKIHSPNAHRKASLLKSDYFYNYFTFGMVRNTSQRLQCKIPQWHVSRTCCLTLNTTESRNSFCIQTFLAITISTCKCHLDNALCCPDQIGWFPLFSGPGNKELCFLWVIASKQHTCIVSIFNSSCSDQVSQMRVLLDTA